MGETEDAWAEIVGSCIPKGCPGFEMGQEARGELGRALPEELGLGNKLAS